MKKLLLLLVAVGICSQVSAGLVPRFRFGVKAGMDYQTTNFKFSDVVSSNYKFDLKFIPQKYQDEDTAKIYYCLDIKTPEIKMSTTELYFAEKDGDELKEIPNVSEIPQDRAKELAEMLSKRAKEYDI